MTTRIGIMGVGGIGGIVGGMLTKAGHDVTLIDQWPEHVDKMKRDGLKITTRDGEWVVPVKALHIHEAQTIAEPLDMGFLAVKSYDTEWATCLLMGYVKADGPIVDFQNGMNDERVAAVARAERTLGCVITIGAALYEPGHAVRTDTNHVGFKIGELDGRDTPGAWGVSTGGGSRTQPGIRASAGAYRRAPSSATVVTLIDVGANSR